jgi:hypothetical protein
MSWVVIEAMAAKLASVAASVAGAERVEDAGVLLGTVVGAVGSLIHRVSLKTALASAAGCGSCVLAK